MDEFYKHKKSDKVKWVFTVIAFIFVFVLLAGLCMQSFAKKEKFKPSNWFTKTEQTQPMPEDNGGAIVSEIESNGVSLSSKKISRASYAAEGISPLADSAYTFTAIIEPYDATNKAVDYIVSFVNPNGAWATGKSASAYFSVSQATDGALKATGTCLEAFGEQIKVTVISRDNPEAKAECTVDYAKRLTDVQVVMKKDGATASVVEFSKEGSNYSWECIPVVGVGTVDDSFRIEARLSLAGGVIAGVKANLSDLMKDKIASGWGSDTLSLTTSKSNLLTVLSYSGSMSTMMVNQITNAFLKYSGELFSVQVNAYGTYTTHYSCMQTFNTGVSTFAVGVTGLTVGDSSIIV